MFEVLFLVVSICTSNGECQQYAVDQFNPNNAAEARECEFRANYVPGFCVLEQANVDVTTIPEQD